MTNAAMTPGIHPRQVRMKTMRNEPQPLSTTARGGKRMQRRTRQRDMMIKSVCKDYFLVELHRYCLSVLSTRSKAGEGCYHAESLFIQVWIHPLDQPDIRCTPVHVHYVTYGHGA